MKGGTIETDPAAYCLQVTRKSGSNFYYPLLLLPRGKREALFAVYAFCRQSDDIVDEVKTADEAKKQLDDWREELRRAYEGTPQHPITRRLKEIFSDYPIPRVYFEELINGMEMDLRVKRYKTFEDLYLYCYRSASVVGLACIEVFGYSHPQVKDYAVAQGIALQLTNILRDLPEDLKRDRIYLPQEEMARFGYAEADLLHHVYNDSFIALMRHQSDRAKDYYKKAASLLWGPDRASLAVSEIIRAVYWNLLLEIEKGRFDVFGKRVALSTPRILRIALSAWWTNRAVAASL
jgi:phytoene synthase